MHGLGASEQGKKCHPSVEMRCCCLSPLWTKSPHELTQPPEATTHTHDRVAKKMQANSKRYQKALAEYEAGLHCEQLKESLLGAARLDQRSNNNDPGRTLWRATSFVTFPHWAGHEIGNGIGIERQMETWHGRSNTFLLSSRLSSTKRIIYSENRVGRSR